MKAARGGEETLREDLQAKLSISRPFFKFFFYCWKCPCMCQIQTIVFNFLCKICQSISTLHVHLTDISLHTQKSVILLYFFFTFKLLLLWLLYDLKKLKKNFCNETHFAKNCVQTFFRCVSFKK